MLYDLSDSNQFVQYSTHQALATLVVHVVKQISRHFLPKITSLPTALADYTLLKDIASIAPDVLEPHLDKLNSIFDVTFSSSSGSNANLRFAMLELMNTMLSSFSDGSLYLPLSQKIMKPVLVAANEKFTKVAKEAILVVISLLQVLRPIEATDIKPGPVTNPQIVQSLNQIFDFTIAKCISSDLELEVKEQALLCLGAVVYHAADLIPPASISGQVIPLLLDRLQNESYRLMTIKVISNILVSPFDKSLVDFTPVLSPMLTELSSFLRKAHRQLKLSSLQCLELLLNRYHEVPKDVLEPLMSDLNVLMRESDLHIVSRTIALLTVVIKSFSSNKFVIKEVKSELIPTLISVMVENPHLLVNGPGAGNLTTFWDAVWEAGDLSLHDACLTLLAKTGKSDKNSRQTFSVIAKSMAILASRGEKDWMLKLVNTWLKELKKASPAQQHLSLIALGEVGSRVDLTLDVADLFSIVFGYFSSPSEEVKYAAAFALGNISLGNVEKSLPSILDAIRKNDTQRFLLFITLKEVISKLASVSVAPEHLRKVAPDIWSLLIQNLDSVDEDTVRNAIAECLGKISLFDPNTYMPQLQSQIKSEKTVVKSTAITAVRFTLTDTLVQQDEFELVLTPLLHDILSIPQDADTLVVRMALSTLTSAAHNKPNLVKRMIGQVCTFVYYSTVVRKELIQMVDFGPFKHRVDDGLEARKAAFEFMDTLLDSCLPSIEIYEFIAHVVSGLADESDEIKIIAFLMLQRLTQLHPKAVAQKLDLVIAPLKACLTRKLKENAVKQELERTKDLKRAATRCCVLVSNVAHDSPTFSAFIEEMKAASPELQELFTSVTTEVTGGHGMMRNKSVDMMEF